MTTRTKQITIRFSSPFRLPGIGELQPAGEYRVDQDEELVESVSRLAWRRVGAFIHLPAIGSVGSRQQMAPVDPDVLDAVIERDRTAS